AGCSPSGRRRIGWLMRCARSTAPCACSMPIFVAGVVGWADGDRPLLVLEDLREAHWPPPWRPGDVDRVLATLERMWALPAGDLPSAEDVRTVMSGWRQIVADPSAFLRLGIASPRWVRSCVPVLRDAADAVAYRGGAF